jgi:aquaporin Z
MKKYLTEGIGTFFLLFITILTSQNPDIALAAPLAAGAALLAMTYVGERISGAHYNPAITLAMLMRASTSRTDAIYYIMAQLIGGVLAALIGGFLLNCNTGQEIQMHYNKMGICSIVAEFCGAFGLTYVFMNVNNPRQTAEKSFSGIAMGFTLAGFIYALRSISGGVFNPALALSLLTIGALDGSDLWIYLAGAILGAAAANTVFLVVNSNEND